MAALHLRQFDPSVQPGETETQTVGCRHSNKLNCGRNGIENVCAFARDDGMCLAPPSSWVRFYRAIVAAEKEEAGET